jgi:hypothetical protein
MSSSGMSRRVALVRTDVSVERCASNFRVKRISELRNLVTANVAPSSMILVIPDLPSTDGAGLSRAHRVG